MVSEKRIRNVADVAAWRLCTGCGACALVCPEQNVNLQDFSSCGIRPVIDKSKCQQCSRCLDICPGIELSHNAFNGEVMPELAREWGPVLEVWEGYASDFDIRYTGSSGGVVTAIALYCLENKHAGVVLHVGRDTENPLRSKTVFSRNKSELLNCTGSRYSPAAPCAELGWIQKAAEPCVFIGKPCDVVGLRKFQQIDPAVSEKLCLAISIFCAGTPSSEGTKFLLDSFGVSAEQVVELRYRGNGWPGKTVVKLKAPDNRRLQMSYEQSWGEILSKYVQLRCRLCPDSTGEFADISVGDPWYRKPNSTDPGQSLVLVRTEKGKDSLAGAMEAGYVTLYRVDPSVLAWSQKSLLKKRQNLWGRLLAMRMMMLPRPRYSGFSLFSNWRSLTVSEKMRSFLGTLRRIVKRNWIRRSKFFNGTDEPTKT